MSSTIREAPCKRLTALLITAVIVAGTLNQMFNISMALSRMPLAGSESRYRDGASRTCFERQQGANLAIGNGVHVCTCLCAQLGNLSRGGHVLVDGTVGDNTPGLDVRVLSSPARHLPLSCSLAPPDGVVGPNDFGHLELLRAQLAAGIVAGDLETKKNIATD
jgi:hypothetical protein